MLSNLSSLISDTFTLLHRIIVKIVTIMLNVPHQKPQPLTVVGRSVAMQLLKSCPNHPSAALDCSLYPYPPCASQTFRVFLIEYPDQYLIYNMT